MTAGGVLDTRTDITGDKKAPAGATVDDNNRHSRRKSRSLGMLVAGVMGLDDG
jgi:hypothetical protein